MPQEPSSIKFRDYGIVNTIHILRSGEVVSSVDGYMKVEDRFLWVDKLTDDHKRSVIVIYEEGHIIREYVNVEHEFVPLAYC